MTGDIRAAIVRVAESEGWDKRTLPEVGLLLWSLFRYYVIRLGSGGGLLT
ncbi:MAG TPA: hypothetical protein VNW90_19215 [Acetobacteraceae bacterium]|jgi:hypothetical protein|nr:hypothetical protein [Acetobacteraceae bacterium]